ncbi:MAG: CehA/McbA family metallohydrolase [Myxococcales bacterium]|nr:CehA/McbA family metallohydrolase [Myxococcales bacterium]
MDPDPAPTEPLAAPSPPEAPPTSGLPETANVITWKEMVADRDAVRHAGDGGGRVVAVSLPPPVEVGSAVELVGELIVGPMGIREGGAIQLVPTPFWGWSPPQADREGADGYTTLEAPVGVTLDAQGSGGMLTATVRGRALRPDERVRFTYGAGQTARADRFAERAPALWVAVDADGDGVRSVVRDAPLVVTTVAGPPAGLVATLPSVAAPGEEVTLRLAVLDAVGNAGRPVDLTVHLALPPGVSGPDELHLRPEDAGIGAVSLRSELGVIRVGVTADGLGEAVTNPMIVRDGAERVLWADLHVHTALSDGTGDPDDVLAYARDVAALDVVALTDHDHWGMVFLDDDPAGRQRIASAVVAAARPGFVPLVGYEWTSWLYGHRNVVYLGPAPEVWPSSLAPGTETPQGLHEALRGTSGMAIVHHPAGGPVALDWSTALAPEVEPCVELSSVHGQSASPELPGPIYDSVPGTFVEDHLGEGPAVALLGSSDSHDGHPGLTRLAGGGAGLTALESAEPTVPSIRDALLHRRTWATNGPRIVLRVRAGDVGPGGDVHLAGGPPDLEIRVVGTAPVDRVEVRSGAGSWAALPGSGSVFHAVVPFPEEVQPGERWWVRVVQQDGGLAWSSPMTLVP